MTKETINADRLHQFQHTIGKPFIANLKENISSRFASNDIVSAIGIFDPQNAPRDTLVAEFPMFGKNSISLLHNHYGFQKPALTLDGQETVKLPIINSEVHSELVTFRF